MKIALFYHSLLSDWNHGNAHFLRGYADVLQKLGHDVIVYEPADGWSLANLAKEHGTAPVADFEKVYPGLKNRFYHPDTIDFDEVIEGMDLVVVHEWNPPEVVKGVGKARAASKHCRLLFHDTHHRSVTNPEGMEAYDLSEYDGVLAFGETVRDIYTRRSWAARAWTWHEAADTRVFRPIRAEQEGDAVWIGNWGDDERSAELGTFLLEPVAELGLRGRVYGVRYPPAARRALERAKLGYGGWLPNYKAPDVFARFRFTVHIPRRPYVEALPGIPTIRPFEAMACGIPLICSPWEDSEHLFHPGEDYLVARSGKEMKRHVRDLMHDGEMVKELSANGLRTILERHTCIHRVEELLGICRELEIPEEICAPASTFTTIDRSTIVKEHP